MEKIELTPIGVIHSPFREPGETPIQAAHSGGAEATVEIYEKYAEGLDDLDGFDCIWILWYSHRAGPSPLKVVPYMDTRQRGVFATRAPSRPNPIGLSRVRLKRREHNKLVVSGVDMIEGTPVLDLKPYISAIDASPGCERDGWLAGRNMKKRADNRFAKKPRGS
ncbi:MAG TPA: tRNA (N6-threonylcarbamoyladenosine(37)-N6)-methyltransferase TrmO [bacterium]|nr:tRNA (N6-threonylcarbamoyladenosine(37)-N6)-methyltransferase TrmO [bacterium]